MRATQLRDSDEAPTPWAIESPRTTHSGRLPAIAAREMSRHWASRGLTCWAIARVPRLTTLIVRVKGRGAHGSRSCNAATTGW
jgi:hypothetical protein